MTTSVYPVEKFMRHPVRDVFFFTASVLFAVYLFLLAKLLFWQFHFHWGFVNVVINRDTPARKLLAMTNVIPFYKILYYARGCEPYRVGVLNVVGNLFLFIPMGLALPFFFSGLNTAKRLAKTAALTSLVIEVLQLITVTGVFDADDVLLNTAGALLGYWVFCKLQKPLLPKAPGFSMPFFIKTKPVLSH